MTPILSFGGPTQGGRLFVDLAVLLRTRAYIQAASGGGKSHLLRQLLEETQGLVQQIVFDPEGEFATLREKFPYLLAAAREGDVVADPRHAGLLCRKVMELGASVIIDLYELKPGARREFVRRYLTEMMALPKRLWNPALVIIDELGQFAPEKGDSEALEPIIDLDARGRKRGWCLVGASQRISSVNKNAIANAHNRLIGLTGLDVDVKRAGDDLGMDKEARQELRQLEPGEFFAYGPALSKTVIKVRSRAELLTRPQAEAMRGAPPPPAPEKIRKMMAEFADLPKEAEEEARTLEDLRKQNRALEGELRKAKKAQPAAGPTKTIEKKVVDQEAMRREITRALNGQAAAISKRNAGAVKGVRRLRSELERVGNIFAGAVVGLDSVVAVLETPVPVDAGQNGHGAPTPPVAMARTAAAVKPSVHATASRRASEVNHEGVSRPQQRMLDALNRLAQAGLPELTWGQLAALSDQSPKSSGYEKNISTLRSAGLIENRPDRRFTLSDAGLELAAPAEEPGTLEELHAAWQRYVSGPQWRMLEVLIDAYPEAVDYDDLAGASDQSPTSSGYEKNVSTLLGLDLITKGKGKAPIAASDLLFPEGLA